MDGFGSIPVWVVLLYLAFNAAVQALPSAKELTERGESAPGWYIFGYRLAHGLAMNIKLAFKNK